MISLYAKTVLIWSNAWPGQQMNPFPQVHYLFTLQFPISDCIFSLLFSIYLLRYLLGEFLLNLSVLSLKIISQLFMTCVLGKVGRNSFWSLPGLKRGSVINLLASLWMAEKCICINRHVKTMIHNSPTWI